MKKRILVISLIAVLALSLTVIGCGEVGPTPVKLHLVFSDHNPEPNACAQALTTYARYIEDHSNGEIKVDDIGYFGELLPVLQVFEGLQSATATVDAASYVPEIGDGIEYLNVMMLPFMGWKNAQQAIDIYAKLVDDFPEILGQFPASLTFGPFFQMPPVHIHFYDHGVVVDSPDDIAGMEFVVMEGTYLPILESLGAVGDYLSFPELASAFAAHQGDGFIQHAEFLYGAVGIDSFLSHTIFVGGFMMTPIGVLWNTDSYNAVVDIVGEQVMADAAATYVVKFFQGTAVDTAGAYQTFASRNDTVTTLTAEQTAAWAAATAGAVDTWAAACDDPDLAQDIYEAAKVYIAAG